MNDLSWLIYLAWVAENFRGNLNFLVKFSAFLVVGTIIVAIFLAENEKAYEKLGKFGSWCAIVCVIGSIILTFVPNRTVILLVAASEIGERFVTNQQVKNLTNPSIDLLTKWIEREVENISKPTVEKK